MLKHCCKCLTWNENEVYGLDANKAQGKAKCLLALRLCVKCYICVKHKQGNAIIILKNFHLDVNVFASPCSLNGGSLIDTHEL